MSIWVFSPPFFWFLYVAIRGKQCKILISKILSKDVPKRGMFMKHWKSNLFLLLMSKSKDLRVRDFFHKTFRVFDVCCNFILDYMCQITVMFGTLEDGSLLIDSFASNNCHSCRHISQNGFAALLKLDDTFFDKKKNENIILFEITNNAQILLACGINTSLITELQIWFQTSDVSTCNGSNKYPIGTSIFYTDFYVQALSCFHCCC